MSRRKVRSNCCLWLCLQRLLAYLIVEAWLQLSATATNASTGTANADSATGTANAANDAHATEHGLRCGDHLRGTDDITERMSWTRLMHLLNVLVRGNAASTEGGGDRELGWVGEELRWVLFISLFMFSSYSFAHFTWELGASSRAFLKLRSSPGRLESAYSSASLKVSLQCHPDEATVAHC